MGIIIKVLEILFSDLTPNQKFAFLLAIIFGVVIYLCVAMITKTTVKFLGIEMKSDKKDNDNV